MERINLGSTPSLVKDLMADLRNVHKQNDRGRFNQNIEKIGQIFAYEISKHLPRNVVDTKTPLGTSTDNLMSEQPVVATLLRAGMPLHNGLVNYFPQADSAFVSAYRKHISETEFEIVTEYIACPSIENRTLIIADPMLATGRSMLLGWEALKAYGTPKHIHFVSVIASEEGVKHVEENAPENSTIWCAAIDPSLNDHSYIVPGLGDAGDLAFGPKLQH